MFGETSAFWPYRPPYLEEFFGDVARRLALTGSEDLLDLGCGTGNVALGFAPYVATLTGVDVAVKMIEETRERAARLGRNIRLICSSAEDAPLDLGPFELITIGQAHWFMRTPATLARIDRWLAPGGHVMICLPRNDNVGNAPWFEAFMRLRQKWGGGRTARTMSLSPEGFFAGTGFLLADCVETYGSRRIDLDHLTKRIQAYGGTARSVIGDNTDRMVADVAETMAPYFKDGPIVEQHCTRGLIFRRQGGA